MQVENIGARRLHTVLERLVEDISFDAPDKVAAAGGGGADAASSDGSDAVAAAATYRHVIDAEDVRAKLADLLQEQDLSKYIL